MPTTHPTLVTVPCFSGAPWDERQLAPFRDFPVRTMRLPEKVGDVASYADFVGKQVADLDDYVLIGDSFGAVISLTFALRRPAGLRGLLLSGGFAADPVPRWKTTAGRITGNVSEGFYRQVTLRFHADQLASRFDRTAEVPLTRSDYRRLFVENTPAASYTARVASVLGYDVRDELDKVAVPTLLITPADDRLVGEHAAQELREGLPSAREVILPKTGHMFRFTHPDLYGKTIVDFVREIEGAK